MNRLTERINGEAYVKRYGGLTSICYGCDRVGTCKKKKCGFYHAIDKLAAYEDTGFEPEQIKQLNNAFINSQKKLEKAFDDLFKYKDLEEQGLLIKLPMQLGELVLELQDNILEKRGIFIDYGSLNSVLETLQEMEDN